MTAFMLPVFHVVHALFRTKLPACSFSEVFESLAWLFCCYNKPFFQNGNSLELITFTDKNITKNITVNVSYVLEKNNPENHWTASAIWQNTSSSPRETLLTSFFEAFNKMLEKRRATKASPLLWSIMFSLSLRWPQDDISVFHHGWYGDRQVPKISAGVSKQVSTVSLNNNKLL